MIKVPLRIIGLSSSQTQVGSYALVLGEQGGLRRLPIIIGGFEAQAIALEVENIRPTRPMTHDLILSIARAFHVELEEVIITDLKEGVFFSTLVLVANGERIEIDARPSDAIAIAVRYKAPIFTVEKILEEAGVVVRETNEPADPDEKNERRTRATAQSVSPSRTREERIEDLTRRIQEAIDHEDYEEAARLRDEIDKMGSN